MAIQWTEKDLKTNQITKQYTTHVGLTVKKEMKVERVMSDVYSEEWYAVVWNPNTKKDERKKVGSAFELFCGPYGAVTPDLLPQYQQERDRILKEEADKQRLLEQKRLEQQRLQRAIDEHHRPQLDMIMEVVKGRKIPKGTIGKVFWLDDKLRPNRVGLALDDKKDAKGRYVNVAWVNASYLKNTEPFSDPKKEDEKAQKELEIKETLAKNTFEQVFKILFDAKKDGLSFQKISSILNEINSSFELLEIAESK